MSTSPNHTITTTTTAINTTDTDTDINPTMGFTLPSPTSPANQAQLLISKKTQIESDIESQLSILRTNNVTMSTPLVDAEGFPRADIDIYAVRKARVRVIELRNDLRDVMDEIGRALEGVYAKVPSSTSVVEGSDSGRKEEEEEEKLEPFARVDTIAPGSPAAEAGMQNEDLILRFGSLAKSAFGSSSNLTPLATLVAQNENKHIIIRVLRSGEQVFLTLTPRKGWGGRGMLGCHIVPYAGQ